MTTTRRTSRDNINDAREALTHARTLLALAQAPDALAQAWLSAAEDHARQALDALDEATA